MKATLLKVGTRMGDLNDLPSELREKLSQYKRPLGYTVLEILHELDGIANYDELLVGIYRKTGKAYKRVNLATTMLKLKKLSLVEMVEGKKGVYRLKEAQHD